MFILSEFFQSLAFLINGVCQLLYWLLFARIIISWFPIDPYNTIIAFLIQITDPILAPFRRLRLQIGMIDLSPLFAFAALYFASVTPGLILPLFASIASM